MLRYRLHDRAIGGWEWHAVSAYMSDKQVACIFQEKLFKQIKKYEVHYSLHMLLYRVVTDLGIFWVSLIPKIKC